MQDRFLFGERQRIIAKAEKNEYICLNRRNKGEGKRCQNNLTFGESFRGGYPSLSFSVYFIEQVLLFYFFFVGKCCTCK